MDNVPYKIAKNEVFGRYLVASRDIKQGELILKETPTLIGAPINAFPICFKCFTPLLKQFTPCCECQIATICSKNCSGFGHSPYECKFLKNSNLKLKNLLDNSQIVMPLRCFLMRDHSKNTWNEFLQLESHLDKRRNSWIWRNHKINVEEILENLGILKPEDIKNDIIQKICGILDVNTFEIRSKQQNIGINTNFHCLRGLYLKAALMAHDCIGNTHLAVDDDYNLIVHASNFIAKDEIIFFNYSSTLLGSNERREHLKEGKYFDCTCKRCEDVTELGTHLSSLICIRCHNGNVVPTTPFCKTEKTKWQCDNCNHFYSGLLIKSTINECKRLIDALNILDVVKSEQLLQKLQRNLNPQHYLLLELEQNLIASYTNLSVNKENLLRKIELCKHLLGIFEIIEPGISRLQAITLYELSSAQLKFAQIEFNNKNRNQEEFLIDLMEAEETLKKAINLLLYEPAESPEGRLSRRALGELRLLRLDIKQLKNKMLKTIKKPETTKKTSKKKK